MDLNQRLRLWGATHAAARAAEQAAAQQQGLREMDLRLQAQLLRDRANRLHGEIYTQIGERHPRA